VINEELDSQVSAMFDGQLPGAECELLARRLVRDEQLRARWARYALIGAVMRSEPVAAVRTDFARRVSAAIVAEASSRPRRARAQRFGWRVGAGGALVAGVAATAVLLLRQQSAPVADEVVIAQTPPAAAAAVDVIPARPQLAPYAASSREPLSYVVPPSSGGGSLAPPAELANFVVAHSEFSSPLVRRNLLSALVSGDAAEVEKPVAPADAARDATRPGSTDASDGTPAR
jgi:sigma-E factor negative regulatory protein RseA